MMRKNTLKAYITPKSTQISLDPAEMIAMSARNEVGDDTELTRDKYFEDWEDDGDDRKSSYSFL